MHDLGGVVIIAVAPSLHAGLLNSGMQSPLIPA